MLTPATKQSAIQRLIFAPSPVLGLVLLVLPFVVVPLLANIKKRLFVVASIVSYPKSAVRKIERDFTNYIALMPIYQYSISYVDMRNGVNCLVDMLLIYLRGGRKANISDVSHMRE